MAKKKKRKPKNPHKRKWDEMFDIEPAYEHTYTQFGPIRIKSRDMSNFYYLIDKSSGEKIAKYNDYRYAVKQAWYKYKKRLRRMEKILLDQ